MDIDKIKKSIESEANSVGKGDFEAGYEAGLLKALDIIEFNEKQNI